ncbi:hypothetical protein [Halosegnis marinus]|uniref:Uncharacterized protein n=2 Tax=Halosegnis marinus TaxID=3034023 RepID=A0ABD5ZMY7_9EURY|nr:hypothetical protein [Halosegnis sp. DT85]
MASASGGLIESILEMPGRFADIAVQSPEQAVLLALGALTVGVASVVFGVGAVGGIVASIGRALPAGGPPDERDD